MDVFISKESLQHKVISIICAFALVISMAFPGSYAFAEETSEGGETQSEQIQTSKDETTSEADAEPTAAVVEQTVETQQTAPAASNEFVLSADPNRAVTATFDVSSASDNSAVATLYDDGELVFSGTGEMKTLRTYNNQPWKSNRDSIKKVTFETGTKATSLKNYFRSCSNLVEITSWPTGVVDMSYTCSDCTSLTTIPVLPTTAYVLESVFNECTSLSVLPKGFILPDYDEDNDEATADSAFSVESDEPVRTFCDASDYEALVSTAKTYGIDWANDWNRTLMVGASLAGAAISMPSNIVVQGSPITPKPESVTLDGKALSDNDYTITYADSTGATVESISSAGTYTITLTGAGSYYDSVSAQFSVSESSEPPLVDGYYQLSTATQLQWFQAKTLEDATINGKLVNDEIDLTGNGWTPIGTKDLRYAGTFDGNGCEIKGLTVSSAGYAGLFGQIGPDGVVKDLEISGTVASTSDYAGAVAGYNQGTITGIVSNVIVYAEEAFNVGGIAGFNDGGYDAQKSETEATGGKGTITNCVVNGNVTGKTKVGGVAGENSGLIQCCAVKSTVDGVNSSRKNGVGGIVGRNGNNNTALEEGTIDSCYFVGTVGRSGQGWVGGITGFNNGKSSIKNSYMAGTLVAGNSGVNAIAGNQEGASLTTNNYALQYDANKGTSEAEIGIVLSVDELKAAADKIGPGFYTDDATAPINNGYPVLYWQINEPIRENISAATVTIPGGISTETAVSDVIPSSVVLGETTLTKDVDYSIVNVTNAGGAEVTEFGAAGTYYLNLKGIGKYFGTVSAQFAIEEKTEPPVVDGVYQISNATQLQWFQAKSVEDATISGKLLKDVDLNGVTWTPIGTSSAAYAGTFDGDGHTISNLTVSGVGLFGQIAKAGVLKNLTVTDSAVKGTVANVGGLAGKNLGTIQRCLFSGTVEGSQHPVGGLVGENDGTIQYSAFKGDVTCTRSGNTRGHVGGIAGYNGQKGEATYAAIVDSCYVNGNVVSKGGVAGGITAYNSNSTISNCYVVGKVESAKTADAIVAQQAETTKYTNNYYLEGLPAGGEATNPGTSLSSAELKDASTKLDSTGTVFADDDSEINDGYPILAWQVTDTRPSIRKAVVVMPSNIIETGSALTVEPESVTLDGTALTKDVDFTIASYLDSEGKEVSEVINPGDYTIGLKGTGTYKGNATASFTVNYAEDKVAIVNNVGYKTIADAVNAAGDGDVVKFIKDVTVSETQTIPSGKSVVFDLNGKTITSATRTVNVQGTLVLQDSTAVNPTVDEATGTVSGYTGGSITSTASNAIYVTNGGQFTMKSGQLKSETETSGCIRVDGGTEEAAVNSKVAIEGGYLYSTGWYAIHLRSNGAQVDVTGGVLECENGFGVSDNGAKGIGGTTVNVSGGAIVTRIKDEGAISCGLYHANTGEWAITGGTIIALNGAGILERGGTTTISDNAKIVTTGSSTGVVGDAKNQIPCAAVYVDGSNNYVGAAEGLSVAVKGGTFKSEVDCVGLAAGSQGTSADGSLVLTGGTYSSDPTAFCAEDYSPVKNSDDTWTVTPDDPELVDGYYQIKNAYQLEWFAKKVNGGEASINAKIMKDIDVSSSDYLKTNPIAYDSSRAFTGELDGNGKIISNLDVTRTQYYVGLIGNNAGTIKNVTVAGAMTLSTSLSTSGVGGVAGKNTGTIDGVTSLVTVKMRGSEPSVACGGIVGENSGTVKNSLFNGSVSGYSYAGGIAGKNSGTNAIIEYCASTGSISSIQTGTAYVGGITASNEGTVDSNYFTGTIALVSAGYNGGIVGSDGYSSKGITSAVKNNYMAGILTGAVAKGKFNAICGSIGNGSKDYSNNYALEGYNNSTTSDARCTGTALSQTDLKGAADLLNASFTAFVNQESGYPLLYWQAGGSLKELCKISFDSVYVGNFASGSATCPNASSFAWEYSTDGGTTWSSMEDLVGCEGYDTTNIKFLVTKERSNYQYRCVATLEDGTQVASDFAKLNVKDTPSEATFAVEPVSKPVWSYGESEPAEPALSVKSKTTSAALTKDVDYTVEWENNVETGTATATVTATGSDWGTVSVNFNVVEASSALEGDGTEESPYLIGSKLDWQFVSHRVALGDSAYISTGKYYKITSDFSLDATSDTDLAADPLGIAAGFNSDKDENPDYKYFGGNIDGDGHTITLNYTDSNAVGTNSLYQFVGLIACAGDGNNWTMANDQPEQVIQNLTIAGSISAKSSNVYTGGFVGAQGGTQLVFSNCINNCNVTNENKYVAGFVAYSKGALLFKDCENKAGVTGKYASGFVSFMSANNTTNGHLSFNNCTNGGKINSVSNPAGGFVASLSGVANNVEFSDCSNTGEILATSSAGGFVGLVGGPGLNAVNALVFARCYNSGNVTSTSTAATTGAGGFVGTGNRPAITITDCYNVGDISHAVYAGGFIGLDSSQRGKHDARTISGYNAGKVTVTGASTSKAAGAFIGYMGTTSVIVKGDEGQNTWTLNGCYLNQDEIKAYGASKSSTYATYNDNSVAESSDELKAVPSELGDAFGADTLNKNDGYPVLNSDVRAKKLNGGDIVTTDGEYWFEDNATGEIVITEGLKVTLNGVGDKDVYEGLNIKIGTGTEVTIRDFYAQYATKAQTENPIFDFPNGGTLNIEGTNVVLCDQSQANGTVVKIPQGQTLNLGGDGTWYSYVNGVGAVLIGASNGGVCGNVNINSGTWFFKNSKRTCSIGGDSKDTKGGTITFNGGECYFKGISMAPALGSTFQGLGSDIIINGGTVATFQDFSGASISGNGEPTFTFNSGSLKTIRSTNSLDSTSETDLTSLQDSAVAAKHNYGVLTIDLGASDKAITITEGENTLYSGTGYNFVTNEVKNPGSGALVETIIQNWMENDESSSLGNNPEMKGGYPTKDGTVLAPDTTVQLWLSKAKHTLNIDGTEVTYYWSNGEFTTTDPGLPKQDEAGVYQIENADQLAWFANEVNTSDATISGALVSDIDLADVDWTPIGTKDSAFAGTFDGQGHAITNLSVAGESYVGLFGNIGAEGSVKDFTLSGAVTGTGDYTGAVAGYNAGTIDGVVSSATVTGSNNTGGIAGFNDGGYNALKGTEPTGGKGVITNCSTSGTITNDARKLGGIAGENSGLVQYCFSSATVDSSYNSKKNGVGGIVGRNGNDNDALEAGTIDSCYFVGTVGHDGQRWVGGITGFNNAKSTVTNNYMAGTLVNGYKEYNAIVGNQEGESNTWNNYSLDSIQSDSNTEACIGKTLSSDELKAAYNKLNVDSTAFAEDKDGINNGYPVLYWQNGGTLDKKTTTYTVTFDANGGDLVGAAKQSVEYGKTAVEPKDAMRDGYTFKGWSSTKDGTKAFDFSTAIKSDMTLYAMWEKQGAVPDPVSGLTELTMYRLYNPNSGEHFYTAFEDERQSLITAGWNDEGVGWIAPTQGISVYRLYSGTDHHYTTSWDEAKGLVAAGWSYEGVGWFSDKNQAVPLYRQFNPYVDPSAATNNSGSHNYTTSKSEANNLVSLGWNDEGIGWYALREK